MKNCHLFRANFGRFLCIFGPFFANFSHAIFREKYFARPSFVFAKNAKNCAALISAFKKCKNSYISKFRPSECVKMADFALQESSKLISRKIWMIQKQWNFHSMNFWNKFFDWFLLQNSDWTTVKTLIRAAALIKFQAFIGGSYSNEAINWGRLLIHSCLFENM